MSTDSLSTAKGFYAKSDLDKQCAEEALRTAAETRMRDFVHVFTVAIVGEIFHIHLYLTTVYIHCYADSATTLDHLFLSAFRKQPLPQRYDYKRRRGCKNV
jgi:hypothetical protein